MSTLDRRQVLRLFGAAAAVGVTGAAAACASQPEGTPMEHPNGRSVSVGLLAPAVGAYGEIGDEITKGFRLYLDDHSGLLGLFRADLQLGEEGATVADATSAVKALLAKGVVAIAGVANPAVLAALAPVVSEAAVPLLSANGAPASIGGGEWVWRASYVEGEAGTSMAGFARRQGDAAFILRDESPSSRAEADGFGKAFTALGGVITGSSVGVDAFGGRLQSARGSGADSIFAAHTGDAASALLVAYRAVDSGPALLGPGTLTESIDLTKLGALPQRVYTSMNYAPDLDNEENRRFVAGYQKVHLVQPTSAAMAAYDTASVLDKALRLVDGEVTPAKIGDGLKVLGQIDSPRGVWTFNMNRAPQQMWYLRRLRLDGQVPSDLIDSDLAILS